ncbi:MAG: type II toxin-antitoxin system HicA family toxin [Rhodocyclaceae bacterium]|nr:type II toxin-antitoxin system HicA family toxin [Rhodocyclaceae bacterium]
MNATHSNTVTAIFAEPVSKSLAWRRIEAMLAAMGCQVIEGNGSRVRFEKDGMIATFHRPHPAKEAKPYQVRDVRQFLENLGVKP